MTNGFVRKIKRIVQAIKPRGISDGNVQNWYRDEGTAGLGQSLSRPDSQRSQHTQFSSI